MFDKLKAFGRKVQLEAKIKMDSIGQAVGAKPKEQDPEYASASKLCKGWMQMITQLEKNTNAMCDSIRAVAKASAAIDDGLTGRKANLTAVEKFVDERIVMDVTKPLHDLHERLTNLEILRTKRRRAKQVLNANSEEDKATKRKAKFDRFHQGFLDATQAMKVIIEATVPQIWELRQLYLQELVDGMKLAVQPAA